MTLSEVPAGKRVRLTDVRAGHGLRRRLLALGISVGSEFEILHRRGRGVVLGRAGNRVALGGGIAERVQAEVLG